MFIVLLVAVVSALIGGSMASNRNKNPIVWGLICFLFPLIGLIILAASGTDPAVGPVLSLPRGVDYNRWNTLKEVDPDIAAAASEAQKIGPMAEHRLAEKFLTLNDKSYLPTLLQNLQKEAVALSSEFQVINGQQCKVFGDGSVVITRGKHVGKAFSNVSELEQFLASRG